MFTTVLYHLFLITLFKHLGTEDTHDALDTRLMQCGLRARRSRTFNSGFWPCPMWTELSLDSLNSFAILCVVDGEMT